MNLISNINSVDIKKYNYIYCDSLDALASFGKKKKLFNGVVIKTSSPSLLFQSDYIVEHIENRWTKNKMIEFHSTIEKFSIDIFNKVIAIPNIDRERALCVALFSLHYNKTLYKAACLNESDFTQKRLFIKVDGNGGPAGNNMNSPWDSLLLKNINFSSCVFSLPEVESNIESVPVLDRLKHAGLETILYRIVSKISKIIPNFSKKEILVYGENELMIETLAHLIIKGVKIREIKLKKEGIKSSNGFHDEIIKKVLPVYRLRSGRWLTTKCLDSCEDLFIKGLVDSLNTFDSMIEYWRKELPCNFNSYNKKVLMSNCPGNVKGQSLALVCRERGIPFLSFQHGVTCEISQLHSARTIAYDSTVSNYSFFYNKKAAEVEGDSYFSNANTFVVGMSLRHLRMNRYNKKINIPMVYVSTNLYMGNIGLFPTLDSDFEKSLKEKKIVTNVLAKLPHKVRYKTYPEDNKRYADTDPVIKNIKNSKNIDLFQKKIDMRYLISEHKVIITKGATSTLSWPIMSNKPVIFINQSGSPLTKEAENDLSKAIFLFTDSDIDFYEKLLSFLSKPIVEIEMEWKKRQDNRGYIIEKYFTEYNGLAGKRAANIILNKCF